VEHRLADGGRLYDVLGLDDEDISFSGIISGADAAARATALDGLRTAGKPVWLAWDTFLYQVMVRSFTADYKNGLWIPYRLVFAVLQAHENDAAEQQNSRATVRADLVAAGSLAAPAWPGLTDVAGAVAVSLQTAADVAAAVRAVHKLCADADLAIERGMGDHDRFASSSDAPTTALFLAVTDQAGRLAGLLLARAYLNHARMTLEGIAGWQS
jgi:hypothetical protein